MVGHTKSDRKQHQEHATLVEDYMKMAIHVYQEGKMQEKGKTLQEVCTLVEKQCWEERHVKIHLAKSTLGRQVKGGKSHAQANAELNSWLTDKEAEVVLQYTVNLANKGWPFSQRCLEEHADLITGARHGPAFKGVGKNWVHWFQQKHSDRLQAYWSNPLDTSRARSVNKHIHQRGFHFPSCEDYQRRGRGGAHPTETHLWCRWVWHSGRDWHEGAGLQPNWYLKPTSGTERWERKYHCTQNNLCRWHSSSSYCHLQGRALSEPMETIQPLECSMSNIHNLRV